MSDAICIYFSFWLSYEVRFFFEPFLKIFPVTKGIPPWDLYDLALRTCIPLWILTFAFWGQLYRFRFLDAADEFLAVLKSASLGIFLAIGATFLYRTYEYSRLVMALAWLVSVILLFGTKELWKIAAKFLYDKVASLENVFLIMEGKICETVLNLIKKEPHKNPVLYSQTEFPELSLKTIDKLKPREVIVQSKFLKEKSIEDFLELCDDEGIEIKVLPEFLEMRMGEILLDNSLGIPILHLKPLSLHGFRFFVKRTFDISISLLLISVLFLPLLVVAILIMLDSRGGVFFWQERVGYKEKIFKCLKFRTMVENADRLLAEMQLESFRGGPAFKMKDDPRITRMGRFLRKWSLDELPQIWNVLKGEMSLIGPRPQVLAEARGNPDWARKRYRILPGITGLWQVAGRADLTYEDMMRLDIYYLENWSPGLDLRILLKTLPVVLGRRGAY